MSKKHLTVKPHIFTFYHIFSRVFFLLIFPFLQQIFLNPESIWQRIAYTVLNTLLIVFIGVVICLEYKQISYIQHTDRIVCKKGFFRHNEIFLPIREITVISVTRSIILWLVHCNRVYIGSSTCFRVHRAELFTGSTAACKIINLTTGLVQKKQVYKSRLLAPFFMSLTRSNTLTGTLALSVILNRLSILLGERASSLVADSLSFFQNLLAGIVPPALAYAAGTIFAGFLFELINQIISNAGFTCLYSKKHLYVYKGVLKKSILCINRELINGVLIKQSLLMCIAGLYTLSVLYTGIKEDKNSGVYIPLTFGNRLNRYVGTIVPVEKACNVIRPQKKALKSYLCAPLIFLLITAAVCLRLSESYNTGFISSFSAVALVPFGVLWLWFRLLAYKHCGIAYGNKSIRVNYYSRLNLMSAVIYKSSVTKVEIRQSPWQQIFKKCHLILYVCDKKKITVKVKHLSLKNAVDFAEDFMADKALKP